jgi:hypothetical protein
MSYISFNLFYSLVLTENEIKNQLIILTHGCTFSKCVNGYVKESFCFDFCIGSACGAIILQWPLAQLFPAAWASIMGQCSVYLL